MKKLGKYEIKCELGKGAMGVVYEGFDPFIKRKVAIKTVMKSMFDSAEAQNLLNRFRVEAESAGRMTHPNIVAIYEYNEDEDIAFIVMEFIKGKELKVYFDSGERFQIRDAVQIMSQLLLALQYSHKHRVIHRDIKPGNIILTESRQVKVADFGIARIESSNLTQVGTVLGTPSHMSPEQFMGVGVDYRTDLYSAGVILYQFITGESPYTGSIATIMHKVLQQEPVVPSLLNLNIPKALDAVVKRAMAKRREDRFQSAKEFIDALRAATRNTIENDSTAPFLGAAANSADATIIAPDAFSATASNTELDLWKSIKNSQVQQDFLRYLNEYPLGEFVELANMRIVALQSPAKSGAADHQQQLLEQVQPDKAWAADLARNNAERERLAKEWAEAETKRKAEQVQLQKEIAEVEARRKADQARLEKQRLEAKVLRKAAQLKPHYKNSEPVGKSAQDRLKYEEAFSMASGTSGSVADPELTVIAQPQIESRKSSVTVLALSGVAALILGAGIWFFARSRNEPVTAAGAPGANITSPRLLQVVANPDIVQRPSPQQKIVADTDTSQKAEQDMREKEQAEARHRELAVVEQEHTKAEARRKEFARIERENTDAETRRQAEQARLEKEKADALHKSEQARLEKEKADALHKSEQARLEKEKSEALLKAEQARLEKEKAEALLKAEKETKPKTTAWPSVTF